MDTRTLNTISICSGVGGLDLGIREVVPVRTILYVEREAYACGILATRMAESTLDEAPIWSDLKTLDPEPWCRKVDMLIGGPPCQTFSTNGNQDINDPRNLFPDVIRLVKRLGLPEFLFFENVPGILSRQTGYYYWNTIRPELRKMEYSIAQGLFSSAETGGSQRRQRLFILAYLDNSRITQDREQAELRTGRLEQSPGNSRLSRAQEDGQVEERRQEVNESRHTLYPPHPGDRDRWEEILSSNPILEPTICKQSQVQTKMPSIKSKLLRSPNGTSDWLDRIKGAGNAVVPAVAALAFRTLARELKIEGLLMQPGRNSANEPY